MAPIQNKSRRKKKAACYLPDEIICNILFRIPVKNLAKFKCTSKYWLFLITKPYFRNHFLTQHTHYDYGDGDGDILFSTYEKIQGVTATTKYEMNLFSINERTMKPTLVNYICNQNNLILQSSCNGLLLFTNLYDPNHLCISNPVTNQLVSLPPSKYFRLVWTLIHDSCADTYSVHGISTNGKLLSFIQGEVDWKETSIPKISNGQNVVYKDPILVNRELVWLTEDVSEDEQDAGSYICYFNIQTNEITRKHIPPCYGTPSPLLDRHQILSQIQGSLCLTIICPDQIDMFVLIDRVSNHWKKCHSISLATVLFDKPKSFIESFLSKGTCSFAMRNADSNSTHVADCLKLMVHYEGELYFCDLKNQQWKLLAGFFNKEKCLSRRSIFHSYSLVDWERRVLRLEGSVQLKNN